MILDKHFNRMLKAKEAVWLSNCKRRKIGVYIPLPDEEALLSAIGSNTTQSTKQCCTRDNGVCPAIHAEVNAIINTGNAIYSATELYIWAETPCHQCLSFIHRRSYIREIFCLTPESYGIEYPRVLDRTCEIKLRNEYASILGIDVHQLDAKEILEYGLLRLS